ncbi:shTK domain protein [Ancylostoma ceylanicum]|uniref:ShTK domain protein n=1 Tax=Ancylostoma ceylanicum TaxID=53326 RepID=A0A0D6LRV7_9BILA|nr:shTK domain protein [Ancylostoma ceylanicum]
MLFFLFAELLAVANSQNPCFATNLSTPQDWVCSQIKAWDAASRMQDVPTANSLTPGVNGQSQPITLSAPAATSGTTSSSLPTDRYQCFTLQCLCQFFTAASWNGTYCNLADGTVLQRVTRKEYRQMTAAERELLANHDELEIGIRTTAVTVAGATTYPYANMFVPYWDSTMDDNINLYSDLSSSTSMIFSSDLLGSVISGNLVDGQFANFVGTIGEVTQRALDQYPGQLFLFQAATVNTIVTQQTLNQVLAATAGSSGCPSVPNSNIELRHGDVHVWMGGFMQTITTSTNDPIFFLHHAFIDFIWEQWRLNKQTRSQRETQWNTGSTSCYSAAHRSTATMTPFTGMINSGGLSNQYTDNLYTYAPQPTCSSSNPNGCNSALIHAMEAAKEEPAFNQSDAPRPIVPRPQPLSSSIAPVLDELCFNMNQCCSPWAARGECYNNPGVMRIVCPASCGWCSPRYNLGDNCVNRASTCKQFVLAGQCSLNYQWMAENCRKECKFCALTRDQACPEADLTSTSPLYSRSQKNTFRFTVK